MGGAVALTKKNVSAAPFLHSMKNKAFATFSSQSHFLYWCEEFIIISSVNLTFKICL